ncbi:MAG TPA: xanthine dehydrogenase family protein subunit M [Candidatus Atribacteria bacterium]|nr:xanthine dehydrogenase family protein subunit M [Candidatus Atribacteria bacterium]
MKYLFPKSIKEALEYILSEKDSKFIAGGTDLIIQISDGFIIPQVLIDLSQIEKLKKIERTEEGFKIGAAVTLEEIASSKFLPQCLIQGAKSIGSPQIRNLGTIGGNICNASPCGDILAPIIVLEGELILISPYGEREVPAKDFFIGPKKTILAKNEILTEIVFKKLFLNERNSSFRKIGKRNGQTISQVNVAIWLKKREKSNEIEDIRIAVGSVAPIPLRLEKVEIFLKGRTINQEILKDALKVIDEQIKPISDVRASENYRRMVIGSLFQDAFKEIYK